MTLGTTFNYRPVAHTEPDGPGERLVEGYRQGFCHHVPGFQYPGADGANHEGTPVNLHLGNITVLNHGYLLERYSLGFIPVL